MIICIRQDGYLGSIYTDLIRILHVRRKTIVFSLRIIHPEFPYRTVRILIRVNLAFYGVNLTAPAFNNKIYFIPFLICPVIYAAIRYPEHIQDQMFP